MSLVRRASTDHSSPLSAMERRRPFRSESELGELSVEGSDALVLGSRGLGSKLLLLGGIEGGGLDLSLLLEGLDDFSLGPAGERGELAQRAVVSAGLEAESAESVWDHHSLFLVVGEGDTFEDLQLTESGGASWELVGEHATQALPENARGRLPMLGSAAWVCVNALLHGVLSNDLVSLERAGLENLLTSDNSDSLSLEKFLGKNACKAALKMASSVND